MAFGGVLVFYSGGRHNKRDLRQTWASTVQSSMPAEENSKHVRNCVPSESDTIPAHGITKVQLE